MMKNITWAYSIPLTNKKAIEEFQNTNGVKLSADLIKCINDNNGGMPDLNIFDTDKTKGRTIKALLSFNSEDEENIYTYLDLFRKDGVLKMIPFAIDSFGNFICLEGDKVVVWLHETDTKEFSAKNFAEFLESLYKE